MKTGGGRNNPKYYEKYNLNSLQLWNTTEAGKIDRN
jgi:hypothetical protein